MSNNVRNPTTESNLNFLDRAIAIFSPQIAYERMRFRNALNNGHKAGGQSASRANWTPIIGTGESINKISRDRMRARARDAERNSDIANGILLAYRRNIVGRGFNLQSRTKNEAFNELAEKLWRRWSKPENCDLTGQQSLREMLNMIVQRYKVDGGILIIKTYVKDAKYPFKIQIREVDDIDGLGRIQADNGNVVVNGIELDKYNRPTAYYLKKTDPNGFTNYEIERVEAERVLFFWQRQRPSEYREISSLARSLPRIRDTDDYLETVSFAHKIAASLALVITQKFPDGIVGGMGRSLQTFLDKFGTPMPPEKKIQGFGGGDILYLEPGQDATSVIPTGAAAETKEFTTTQQRLAAAGQGLSHESASRDVSEVNYSSARQNLLEDEKTYLDIQMSLIEHVLCKMYEVVIKSSYQAGLIPVSEYPDFWTNLDDYLEHEFIPQGMPWIDPQKEANAKKIGIESMTLTRKDLAASEGKDWKEQLKQLAAEKQMMEELGLEYPVMKTTKGADTDATKEDNGGTGGDSPKNEGSDTD